MSIITLSLKIFLPNVSERIQMLLGDGQHLFKDVPIDNIWAWRVREWALIVIEVGVRVLFLLFDHVLLLGDFVLRVIIVVFEAEELGEINFLYDIKVEHVKLLDERVAVIRYLEQETSDRQSVLILLPAIDTAHYFMDNVHF